MGDRDIFQSPIVRRRRLQLLRERLNRQLVWAQTYGLPQNVINQLQDTMHEIDLAVEKHDRPVARAA